MNPPSLTSNLRFLAEQSMSGRLTLHSDLSTGAADPDNDFETFSYAVAHGLRASLRSVNGFAKMLIEDKATELDAEANEYLKIIRENALRMDRLVDDLLLLSRYYTSPLNKEEVNLNKLVSGLVTGMRFKGELSITQMEPVTADAEMLQQLWFHLVNNALKFSSKVAHPVIEIGTMQKDGVTIYYVKDNGAGFDMKYAGRLFTAFHRMHTEAEFPGAGIGLAVSYRVVKRHGGQIWAEAETGKGDRK